MAVPEPTNHRITLAQGRALAQRFRDENPTAERAAYFGRAALEALLAHERCAGIRIYHGRQANGAVALVLVAVDAENRDIVDGAVIDEHRPCPPYCDPTSPLNG